MFGEKLPPWDINRKYSPQNLQVSIFYFDLLVSFNSFWVILPLKLFSLVGSNYFAILKPLFLSCSLKTMRKSLHQVNPEKPLITILQHKRYRMYFFLTKLFELTCILWLADFLTALPCLFDRCKGRNSQLRHSGKGVTILWEVLIRKENTAFNTFSSSVNLDLSIKWTMNSLFHQWIHKLS